MNLSACLLVLSFGFVIAGCGPAILRGDTSTPEYKLGDGSVCRAPDGFSVLSESNGTRQVRTLFLSSVSPQEVVDGLAAGLPSLDELDAAFYLSCGEFARGELSREVFSRQRNIYQVLRIEHVRRGITAWRQDPEGYGARGKLCHFVYSGDQPDSRNVTRLVPDATTVDDCAALVHMEGGGHVLLGCTEGRWQTSWAQFRLLASPHGWVNRETDPAITRYVPQPNCGWR